MRRILRTKLAAEYLGLAESTVEKLRLTGTGPRFLRLGARAVGYDVADLDDWLDACQRSDSREPGPGTPELEARGQRSRCSGSSLAPTPPCNTGEADDE